MPADYNRIAGTNLEHFPCYWVSRKGLAVAFSLEKTPIAVVGPGYTHRENALGRISAISDGIFAVGMTLLVLDLRTPAREAIHSNAELMHTLATMSPQFFTYFISFLTLGIFWMGQQAQLNNIAASDRNFTWMHLAFLLGVSMLPFSTRLLSEFILYRGALLCDWLNILYLGAVLYGSWRYATSANLLSPEADVELRCAIERRVLIAQALYAGAAALCVFDTRISIALILLLQLNYVFAPKLPLLRRI